MLFFGTIVNAISVIIGSLIGLVLIKKLSSSLEETIFNGIGIFTIFIGIKMSFNSPDPLSILLAIIIGGIIGELLNLENKTENIFNKLEKINKNRKYKNLNYEKFSQGIITAFLLFCIGSMTIIGTMEEAINKNSSILLTKSIMDGFSSIILASSFGISILFSSIPLFIFQSFLTLIFFLFGKILPQDYILQISGTGGLIIIFLGLNLLKIKKIRIINFLPSIIFIIPIYYLIKFFL